MSKINFRVACLTLILGAWQIAFALTFVVLDHPSFYNEIFTGLALFLLGIFSMKWPYLRWWIAIVGIWIEFAPLALWAHDASVYLNDIFIGALAIIFASLYSWFFLNESISPLMFASTGIVLFGLWIVHRAELKQGYTRTS